MAAKRRGKDSAKLRAPRVMTKPQRALLLPELEQTACSVQLIGRRCAMVENHGGLISLGRERISVKTREGVLSVCGSGLSLTEVRPDALVVQGRIACVCYPEDDNA